MLKTKEDCINVKPGDWLSIDTYYERLNDFYVIKNIPEEEFLLISNLRHRVSDAKYYSYEHLIKQKCFIIEHTEVREWRRFFLFKNYICPFITIKY